jgi:hypothetical protein
MAKSVSQMEREPTEGEREKIGRAIVAGDRIGATSMYISITECGLTEAQEFIKARTAELQAENPEKFVQKTKETSVLIVSELLTIIHYYCNMGRFNRPDMELVGIEVVWFGSLRRAAPR